MRQEKQGCSDALSNTSAVHLSCGKVCTQFCSQKALESSWIQRAICLYYFTYSFTTRTGCSCISCGSSEAHSMTAQQQGGSSSFTRWLPQNEKGGNAYLSVFSSQISCRNEWKNNIILLHICFENLDKYFYLCFLSL